MGIPDFLNAKQVRVPNGEQQMRYFPVFMDLAVARVVVVGGGEEAVRKVRLLLKTGAKIDVIAQQLHDELASNNRVNWLARRYAARHLDGARLVYSADAALNRRVSKDAQARGIPVNAVDDADISTFIIPSIVDRDPVVVAIGTEGAAPVLAMGLREKIDAMLPTRLGELAAKAQSLRAHVAERLPHGNRRRSFWREFFFGSPRDALIEGDKVAFALALEDALHGAATARTGRVSLIDAGINDPELLTIKAQRKLQEADVIFHDDTVAAAILEIARRDAVRTTINASTIQSWHDDMDTVAKLSLAARKGLNVVWLTKGQSHAWDHQRQAQLALAAASIAVDIVPGVALARASSPAVAAEVMPFPLREDIRDAVLRAAS